MAVDMDEDMSWNPRLTPGEREQERRRIREEEKKLKELADKGFAGKNQAAKEETAATAAETVAPEAAPFIAAAEAKRARDRQRQEERDRKERGKIGREAAH